MNEEQLTSMLREKGMCGHVSFEHVNTGYGVEHVEKRACILPIEHDDGVHEPSRASLTKELEAARDLIAKLRKQTDDTYRERNQLVAALARHAHHRYLQDERCGWRAWLSMHPESDTTWDRAWRTIVFIVAPTDNATFTDAAPRQMSWHLHESEAMQFSFLPWRDEPWDGHTTELKYERLSRIVW